MKEKKKTLLDLDHVPTLDELRAFFRENDFSATAYMDIDYKKLDAETVEALEHIKGMMDEHWEPLSREMGLKASSCYYGKDNPLIAMRGQHGKPCRKRHSETFRGTPGKSSRDSHGVCR